MAVISFERKDFNNLMGKNYTVKELEEKLPLLGFAWEGNKEDELSVELEPNHPEMLCPEGIARMFAGKEGMKKGLPEYNVNKSDYKLTVKNGINRHAAFAVVKGIKFDDNNLKIFMQLQEKLAITMGRNREKAAVGAYDADRIKFPLTYEKVDNDYEFTPLGWSKPAKISRILEEHPKGKEYGKVIPYNTVFIDYEGMCVGMPPVTNSEETKLTTKTKNVFIDVTGSSEQAVNKALNIIVTALADRGGKIFEVTTERAGKKIITPNLEPQKMILEPLYANKLLGVEFKAEYMVKCLEKMRHNAKISKGKIQVQIAGYRTDIMHPIDLVEEIAIAHGYENFEAELSNFSTVGSQKPIETLSSRVRELLVGFGGVETMNFMLSNADNLFNKMNDKQWAAEIENPRTVDYTHFRHSLIPGIMNFLSNNTSQAFPQNVFEVDDVIVKSGNERGCTEERRACYAITHARAGYSEIKSVLDSLLLFLGIEYRVQEKSDSRFISGRSGEVIVGGKKIGVIGEVHPEVIRNWKIENPVALFEIQIEKIQ